MVVGFTTTCAIIAYRHLRCEFEPRSWRGVLDTKLGDKSLSVTCDRLVVFRGGSGISSQGGAHLKKLCRVEEGAKIFGVFRVKNHDFTPFFFFFPNFRGHMPGAPPWIHPWFPPPNKTEILLKVVLKHHKPPNHFYHLSFSGFLCPTFRIK